jgi:hypothetical protein
MANADSAIQIFGASCDAADNADGLCQSAAGGVRILMFR